MKETLEQYIDIENIPKKYGGKLDFEFGDMPILEPAIAECLKFEQPNVQKGANTIPMGPVKWEETLDGTVQAVAVGSEGGKPRRQVVANLQATTSLKVMHGSSIAGTTPVVEKADPLATTTGTWTQPADDPNAVIIETPPNDSSSESDKAAEAAKSAEQQTNGNGEKTRTGTSETRFAAQADTHARDQLAEGTPHDAINDHGNGDKTVTMEPHTIGQAPKDVSLPTANGDEGQKGYVEQAKEAVGAAAQKAGEVVTSAAATAGLVNGTKNEEGETKEKMEDERVEKMEGSQVEEYLRKQNMSTAAAAKA